MTETITAPDNTDETPSAEVPETTSPVSEPETPGIVSETVTSEAFAAAQAESDSILDAIMSRIGDITAQDEYLKILVYGDPGVGKTVFTATSPDWLMVNIEKGGKVLKNHRDLIGPNCQGLEYKSIFQLEQLLKYLKQDAEPLRKFKTVVIDSFSELQKRDLDEIVKVEASKDASRNKFLPIGPDYNINTEHMRVIASDLRDLDRHVIVTCHVKEEKDGDSGAILRRPNLTPKLAGTLAGIFDLVGYYARSVGPDGKEVRTLQVQPTARVVAKTRIGGLPAILENPTFQVLLDAYNK